MRHAFLFGSLLAFAACSSATTHAPTASAADVPASVTPPLPTTTSAPSSWFGAAAESGRMLVGTNETNIGVWIDAPRSREAVRVHVDVALVIDTSGSMAGEKIANARESARTIIESLNDGDIVSIATFSNEASLLVEPTSLDATSRANLLAKLSDLRASGGTNLFDGLSMAEALAARGPQTHPVRRVVLISDGMATVGPSSSEVLGQLAERGLDSQVQVTSLGVGVEYDEKTLDTLAVRSSGRFYHLSDPREMSQIVKNEVALLSDTALSNAFVEVIPARGVRLFATDDAHASWNGGTLRLPLGALFGGQHREGLVRAQIAASTLEEATETPRTIASVRLHYRDAADGGIDRIQEVLARVQATNDPSTVTRFENAHTKSIVAIKRASKWQLEAAQAMNGGHFDQADARLAEAQKALAVQAQTTTDRGERRRLEAAVSQIASSRASAGAVAAAPAPVQREHALKMNAAAMKMDGM